jgi:nucleoside-diphosphate-sugar epimerase
MSTPRHVIIGAGPVGTTTALLLAERGTPVTVFTRRGSGPQHPLVTLTRGDASDTATLSAAATNADAIYNCANPPYHRWPLDWPPIHRATIAAAERTGAVLVLMDNLYAFGPTATMPMRELDPLRATGPKGATRATMAKELFAAHTSGRIRATLVRASDFFGPRVRDAVLGERVVPRVIAGKRVSLLGKLDVPHNSSYMPDVAATLVAIATDERAWGKPWHVPNAAPKTQHEMVNTLAQAAGTEAKVGTVPWPVIRALGMFNPMMRGLLETRYQFDKPFVTNSQLTETTFGLSATPLDEAAAATIAWWRNNSG